MSSIIAVSRTNRSTITIATMTAIMVLLLGGVDGPPDGETGGASGRVTRVYGYQFTHSMLLAIYELSYTHQM